MCVCVCRTCVCVCVCTCVWGAAACLRGCRVKTASPARIYRVHSFRVSSSYRGADRPAPPDQRRSVGRHVDSQPPSPGGPAWSPHPDLKPDSPPKVTESNPDPRTDRQTGCPALGDPTPARLSEAIDGRGAVVRQPRPDGPPSHKHAYKSPVCIAGLRT